MLFKKSVNHSQQPMLLSKTNIKKIKNLKLLKNAVVLQF